MAITQLFRLSTTIQPGTPPKGYAELRRLGRPLGAAFVGIAVLVLALGVHRYDRSSHGIDCRYFTSQYWMTQGKFPASRGAVLVVSSIAASVFQLVDSLTVDYHRGFCNCNCSRPGPRTIDSWRRSDISIEDVLHQRSRVQKYTKCNPYLQKWAKQIYI